jgi:DNA-binding protein HU-beta
MNRSELVSAVAERSGVSAKQADIVLKAFAEIVGDVVSSGQEKVTLPGFLTFERVERAARTARNPRTGEPIEIPAGHAIKVSAGSTLKAAAGGR